MTLTQVTKAGLHDIALDHVFTIGASGSSAYTFQGEGLNGTISNPTLYLTRGKTYRFENGSGGHPIRIQSTSGASGTAYNTGVTNNAGSGTVIVEVQHDAPDVLYYQCTSHAAMNGILYITGALPDGGVTRAKIANSAVDTLQLETASVNADKISTGAVTSVKIAGDAVDGTKLADNAVGSEHITDQAVTLAKLPHGTSSNDGKFLRANNGADPTFETVSAGPTIANQADNRVITATGTTDALNAESGVVIDSSGNLGVGTTSPAQSLHVHDTTSYQGIIVSGNGAPRIAFANATVGVSGANGGAWSCGIDGTNGDQFVINYSNDNSDSKIILSGTLNTMTQNTQVNGNLKFGSSGNGIDFSATANATHTSPTSGQNPSTDSEVLTDYEHGTWTPRIRAYDHTGNAGWGTMVYTDGTEVTGTGRYVKVGRYVWCGFKFESGSKVFDSNWTYWSIDNTPYGANHYDKASGSLYVSQTNFFTDSNSHIGGFVHGHDSYMVVNKPNGHSNATIDTSNNNRYCYGHIAFYSSRY